MKNNIYNFQHVQIVNGKLSSFSSACLSSACFQHLQIVDSFSSVSSEVACEVACSACKIFFFLRIRGFPMMKRHGNVRIIIDVVDEFEILELYLKFREFLLM
jgi:hypothetical protein